MQEEPDFLPDFRDHLPSCAPLLPFILNPRSGLPPGSPVLRTLMNPSASAGVGGGLGEERAAGRLREAPKPGRWPRGLEPRPQASAPYLPGLWLPPLIMVAFLSLFVGWPRALGPVSSATEELLPAKAPQKRDFCLVALPAQKWPIGNLSKRSSGCSHRLSYTPVSICYIRPHVNLRLSYVSLFGPRPTSSGTGQTPWR